MSTILCTISNIAAIRAIYSCTTPSMRVQLKTAKVAKDSAKNGVQLDKFCRFYLATILAQYHKERRIMGKSKVKVTIQNRSAVTGQYVKPAYAVKHPKTTVQEKTVKKVSK